MPDELAYAAFYTGDGQSLTPILNELDDDSDQNLAFSIGLTYRDGDELHMNPIAAAKWFKRAAEMGHAQAATELGILFFNGLEDKSYGNSVKQDYSKALKWCLYAESINRDSEVQYFIASIYLDALRDFANGMLWLKKAADNFYPKAQYRYALRCINEDRHLDAFRYLVQAASNGFKKANYDLALLYLFGNGIKQDDVTSFKYFSEAANSGDAAAMIYLGFMSRMGRGCPKDPAMSTEWYRKSSNLGNPEGHFYYASALIREHSIKDNTLLALTLFAKSAQAGHPSAIFSMGDSYRLGRGCEKDVSRSHAWYRLAIAHTTIPEDLIQDAEKLLRKLSLDMNISELSEAERLHQTLVKKIPMTYQAPLDEIRY